MYSVITNVVMNTVSKMKTVMFAMLLFQSQDLGAVLCTLWDWSGALHGNDSPCGLSG